MQIASSHQPSDSHHHVEVRPMSWLVLACAAFWAVVLLTGVAFLMHH
jgi:hypothetical protein